MAEGSVRNEALTTCAISSSLCVLMNTYPRRHMKAGIPTTLPMWQRVARGGQSAAPCDLVAAVLARCGSAAGPAAAAWSRRAPKGDADRRGDDERVVLRRPALDVRVRQEDQHLPGGTAQPCRAAPRRFLARCAPVVARIPDRRRLRHRTSSAAAGPDLCAGLIVVGLNAADQHGDEVEAEVRVDEDEELEEREHADLSDARSRCRCRRGEPNPGADLGGASPVPVQMWAG